MQLSSLGVIGPTCVELGQLSQQFLRCLIRVTIEWQETCCFVEMADNFSTWIQKPAAHLNLVIIPHLVPVTGVDEGKVTMVRATNKGKRDLYRVFFLTGPPLILLSVGQ